MKLYTIVFIAALCVTAGCAEKQNETENKAVIYTPDGEIMFVVLSANGVLTNLSAEDMDVWLVGEGKNGFEGIYYSQKNLTDVSLDLHVDSAFGQDACIDNLSFAYANEKEDNSRFFEDYSQAQDLVRGPEYVTVAQGIEGINSFSVKKFDKNTGVGYSSSVSCDFKKHPMILYDSDICLTQEEVRAGRVIMIEVASYC